MAEITTGLAAILRRHEARLLADWMSELVKGGRSGAIDKAEFRQAHWERFLEVNRLFAEQTAREAADGAVVWAAWVI